MAKTVLFGRYRLEEPLGAGGSAQVWRAVDTKTGETVAVKRLHPLVFAGDSGRERLVREFRALRDLDEPHIVRVRDLELTDDEGALILDYVAGPSLATRLANEPRLSTAEAVGIVLDVAAALAAAHAAGIVHRDVTPGNILLDPDDGARLTDFGIAGGAGTDGEPALTATGQLVGTLRFVAPEQLRGAPATTSSDVHALAAVTYEMLAGRPAYVAASPVALAEVMARPVDPIPSVPPALDAAVRRALAVDPAERPPDATSFAADIMAALAADRTEPIAVAPPPASATGTLPVVAAASSTPSSNPSNDGPLWAPAAGADAPIEASRTSHPRARMPIPAALALVLVLGAVALAAFGPMAASSPGATPRNSVPAALPAATSVASPAITPEPAARDEDNDGNGKGKGKGKGHNEGGD